MPLWQSMQVFSPLASWVEWIERVKASMPELPAVMRANSRLNNAVRAPPIWRNPVGDGAKRVTTAFPAPVSDIALNRACSQT